MIQYMLQVKCNSFIFQILEALEKDPNDAVTAMDIVKKVYTVRISTTVIMD